MEKVNDYSLVDFSIKKRIRVYSDGSKSRYFVLQVNGDEYYQNSFSDIINTLLKLLFRDFMYPYSILCLNKFIHDPHFRLRKGHFSKRVSIPHSLVVDFTNYNDDDLPL